MMPLKNWIIKHLDRISGSKVINHATAVATFSCQLLFRSSRVNHIFSPWFVPLNRKLDRALVWSVHMRHCSDLGSVQVIMIFSFLCCTLLKQRNLKVRAGNEKGSKKGCCGPPGGFAALLFFLSFVSHSHSQPLGTELHYSPLTLTAGTNCEKLQTFLFYKQEVLYAFSRFKWGGHIEGLFMNWLNLRTLHVEPDVLLYSTMEAADLISRQCWK